MTINETGMPPVEDTKSTNAADPQENVPAVSEAEQQPVHRKAASFVQEHPIATIAGGLALGALAAALIPRRNRTAIARKTSVWAEAVTAASGAIAHQVINQIETAASGVRSQSHTLSDRAQRAAHSALGKTEGFGQSSVERARTLQSGVSEKVTNTAEKLKRRLYR